MPPSSLFFLPSLPLHPSRSEKRVAPGRWPALRTLVKVVSASGPRFTAARQSGDDFGRPGREIGRLPVAHCAGHGDAAVLRNAPRCHAGAGSTPSAVAGIIIWDPQPPWHARGGRGKRRRLVEVQADWSRREDTDGIRVWGRREKRESLCPVHGGGGIRAGAEGGEAGSRGRRKRRRRR